MPFSLSQRERAGVRENSANSNLHSTIANRGGLGATLNSNRKSEIANRKSEGIALIITLILLSVTLVMAVAFLAISRRERNSTSTETDTITAKFAADSALAQAENRIVSQILVSTNPYVFSLVVSTNYVNGLGFTSGSASPTNVNYDFYMLPSSGHLSQQDFIQNVANLYYSPRPPVFYGPDFRFYLDLNRNGRFDTNGVVTNYDNALIDLGSTSVQVGDPEWIGVLEHPDQPHGPNNPFIARYCFIAVPANSLDLDYIHNQVFAAPLGTTVNAPSSGNDEYWRNQGIGSWEMNLAAFLADLNTNSWDPNAQDPWNKLPEPYLYPAVSPGKSIAFDDARSLIAWRYNNYYPLLASANRLFGLGGYNAFLTNGIDYYALGSQTTFETNYYYFPYFNSSYTPNMPWVGAENTNNFFDLPSDVYNTNKAFQDLALAQPVFATNLYNAGTNLSTYDRYTYYRLLGQLGTDTLPASGKINVNYQNAIVTYNNSFTNLPTSITIVPNSETNFTPWVPRDFFTAAANQLLRSYSAAWFGAYPSNYLMTYYGLPYQTYYTNLYVDGFGVTNVQYSSQTNQIPSFGITNIPVLFNGSFVYTPAVNRLLQLAANIYDASTNTANVAAGMSNYPSVFRPIFWVTNELTPNGTGGAHQIDVYIKGYQYVQEPLDNPNNEAANGSIFVPPIEANDPSIRNLAPTLGTGGISTSNVWGVPWIIGAKKGLPNFNGMEVDNTFFIERELQFTRSSIAPNVPRTYTTNQMYIMGFTNTFAIEHWNSYANPYFNKVQIFAQENFNFALSNDAPGSAQINNMFYASNLPNGYLASSPGNFSWPGAASSGSFIMPLGTQTVMQDLSPYPLISSTNNQYIYFYGNGQASVTAPNGDKYIAPCFIPTSEGVQNYPDQATPQLPHLVMQTTNRLWAYMIDSGSSAGAYILDSVQLGGMDNSLDLNASIHDPEPGGAGVSGTYLGGMWSTNTYNGGGDAPLGIDIQYLVSSQYPSTAIPSQDADGGRWTTTPIPGAGTDTSPASQAAYFASFFSASDTYGVNGTQNTNYVMQAPFTPMRTIVQKYVYQANDPMVHYLTSDLNDFNDDTSNRVSMYIPITNSTIQYLGRTSDRYMPWGYTKNQLPANYNNVPTDQNAYNLAYKDPSVWSSDNWDFPAYKYPNVGWLGRVHRGTPWQTVFLKSADIWNQMGTIGASTNTINVGQPTWLLWTGNVFNWNDAFNTSPYWDHLLFDLFTATPNDDATRGQLSVNIGASDPNNALAGLASWSAALSGALAFSNNFDDAHLNFTSDRGYESPIGASQHWPSYSVWTSQPIGGVNPTNTQLFQIVRAINNMRATFPNIDHLTNVFEHVGDVLATPQLSDDSPFLQVSNNGAIDGEQLQYGISDEMYEWLPQQLMGLLTISGTPQTPPRYVVYCYGQTLKPAPGGTVGSGAYFGLCTNYQVTAESASRAVIRVVNAPSPENPTATPRIVIEQYNPLPPD